MTKPNLKTKASVFSMGQRGEVLSTDLEAPILVPHALEKSGTKVSLLKSCIAYLKPHLHEQQKLDRLLLPSKK
jgi:hypothetical protein